MGDAVKIKFTMVTSLLEWSSSLSTPFVTIDNGEAINRIQGMGENNRSLLSQSHTQSQNMCNYFIISFQFKVLFSIADL